MENEKETISEIKHTKQLEICVLMSRPKQKPTVKAAD